MSEAATWWTASAVIAVFAVTVNVIEWRRIRRIRREYRALRDEWRSMD